ncbi:MAG TPA: SMI1/KNR4 family protein [Humisphaera sp.]
MRLSLGFPIPPLLKAMYLNVGNGWSAPGYGVIGVAGSRLSDLGDLAATYQEVLRAADYLKPEWPHALLPFCGWGCNILSCVDCREEGAVVYRSETCAAHAAGYALADFLEMWVDGVDLFNLNAGERATAEIMNPFTRKKTRVTGGRRRPSDTAP